MGQPATGSTQLSQTGTQGEVGEPQHEPEGVHLLHVSILQPSLAGAPGRAADRSAALVHSVLLCLIWSMAICPPDPQTVCSFSSPVF